MSEPDWGGLTEADVDRLTVRVLRRGIGSRPEVRLIRLGGRDAVVKDYGRDGSSFKRLLGAFLAGREAAALRRAAGVPNVPRVLGRARPWMLVIDYVDATPVTALDSPRIDAAFVAELGSIIDRLHARGIAHGDLEKLDNILVTADGHPAVVDFASAVMSGANPVAALVLPYLRDNDERAIMKLKSRYAPELLVADEHERLRRHSSAEEWFRRVRRFIRSRVKALVSGHAG